MIIFSLKTWESTAMLIKMCNHDNFFVIAIKITLDQCVFCYLKMSRNKCLMIKILIEMVKTRMIHFRQTCILFNTFADRYSVFYIFYKENPQSYKLKSPFTYF